VELHWLSLLVLISQHYLNSGSWFSLVFPRLKMRTPLLEVFVRLVLLTGPCFAARTPQRQGLDLKTYRVYDSGYVIWTVRVTKPYFHVRVESSMVMVQRLRHMPKEMESPRVWDMPWGLGWGGWALSPEEHITKRRVCSSLWPFSWLLEGMNYLPSPSLTQVGAYKQEYLAITDYLPL
jgi:hypothetical protein